MTTTPPPRWAVRAAHLTVAIVLPSTLWRAAMALGVPVGFSDEVMREVYYSPGFGTVYMLTLCVLSEAAAFMTLGLVRRWGEVPPRWLPVFGGRRMNRVAVTAAGMTGALLLFLIWDVATLAGAIGPSPEHPLVGTARVVMLACYAPLFAWGPLLAAVTWSYWRRTGRDAASRAEAAVRG